MLFEAEWIHLVHAPPARSEWHTVRSPAELAGWTAAWGEQPPGFFPDVLVGDPAVRFLRTTGGGAIANRSADVIGLSNLFGAASWSEAAAAAQAELGAVPVVGYASGPDLVAAHLAGFESDGPLRVWIDH